jgi:hypothetical protein
LQQIVSKNGLSRNKERVISQEKNQH